MTPSDLAFETPRVKARLLCEDDLDLYLALYTDPEVMRYVGPVMGREEAEAQFRKALALNLEDAGRIRYWAAYTVESAGVSPLGIMSAALSWPGRSQVEIGIMLLRHRQRGGLGRLLLTPLIDAIFDEAGFGVDVVTARHLSQNAAARELFSCLGFSSSVGEDSRTEMCMLTSQQWRRKISSLALAPLSS
ncbi:GNAT family N-acetyltransferase [Lysobacter brunescens]|uniref:GNAT family N-acetyltransferase n=1 Tax=Lysobacter brunescens TaxID=262323 RepID=A0ABW2YDU7_9GAMM